MFNDYSKRTNCISFGSTCAYITRISHSNEWKVLERQTLARHSPNVPSSYQSLEVMSFFFSLWRNCLWFHNCSLSICSCSSHLTWWDCKSSSKVNGNCPFFSINKHTYHNLNNNYLPKPFTWIYWDVVCIFQQFHCLLPDVCLSMDFR